MQTAWAVMLRLELITTDNPLNFQSSEKTLSAQPHSHRAWPNGKQAPAVDQVGDCSPGATKVL